MNEPVKSAYAALLNRLSEMQEAPYYATARAALAEAERVILDLEQVAAHREKLLRWLELQIVEVRQPLRYGSQQLFMAVPTGDEETDAGPSKLRALVMEHMGAAKENHHG